MADTPLLVDPTRIPEPADEPTPRRAGAGWRRGAPAARLSFTATLLLAAALRLPGIPRFILEQDEIYTFSEATDLFHTDLLPGIQARPLFYLLQHALFWLTPPTTVWMRIPPFIFGMLGVALTWWCARRIFGLTAATVAGVLVAISPWHMHASGMARYWSLLYLLALLFFFAALRGYDGDRAAAYRLALLAGVLGTATHPTLLFTSASVAAGLCFGGGAQGVGWRWPSRRAWVNLWLPYGAFLLAAALTLRLTQHGSAVRNWGGRGWTASVRLVPAIVERAGPTLVMAALCGAIILLRSRVTLQRRWGWMALVGCTGTVALLAAASLFTDAYADYSIAMLPLIILSAGAMVQRLSEGAAAPGALAASVALVISAGMLPSTISEFVDGSRFDYRPLFARIRATEPRLPVLAWPVAVQRLYAPRLQGYELKMNTLNLDARLRDLGAFWLIASRRRYGLVDDPDRSLERWISQHCSLVDSYERLRLDDQQFRVDLHRCAAPTGP